MAIKSDVYALIPPYMQKHILGAYEACKNTAEKRQRSSNEMAQIHRVCGKKSVPASSQFSNREVWDASKEISALVLSNSKPVSNPDDTASSCFAKMRLVDAFFRHVFSVAPVSSERALMRSYVHSPYLYNNAGWDTQNQCAIFGDVDDKIFNPIAMNLGMVARAFTYAVTDHYGQLAYRGQSGALRESMCDVLTITMQHYTQVVPAVSPLADWLIGENLVLDKENGALRSMSSPGKAYTNHPIFKNDPQPAHMRDFVTTEEDHGGVHINCGIPNRAFHLTATKISRFTWQEATRIWFRAFTNTADDDFASFAHRTLQATKDLECEEPVYNIVGKAWMEVGVDLRLAAPIKA